MTKPQGPTFDNKSLATIDGLSFLDPRTLPAILENFSARRDKLALERSMDKFISHRIAEGNDSELVDCCTVVMDQLRGIRA